MRAPAGDWTDLGGGVLVRQSRAFHMNSVALFDADLSVLVDPGVLPSELDDLAAMVETAAPKALALYFTHGDWDHVLGRSRWPAAKTVAHDGLAAEIRREAAAIAREADAIAARHGERWAAPFAPFAVDTELSGLRYTSLGNWRVVFRDAPGHSDTQLTLHLPEDRLLIAGDMLSDVEIPMLNRAAPLYRRTLEALVPLVEGGAIDTVVPGHGAVALGRDAVRERFAQDLAYLERLEREVGSAHSGGASLEQTLAALGAWEKLDRHPAYPMAEVHRENLERTYRGMA